MRAFVIVFALCASALAYVPGIPNGGEYQGLQGASEYQEHLVSPANVANIENYKIFSKSAQIIANILSSASNSNQQNPEVTIKSQQPFIASLLNAGQFKRIAKTAAALKKAIASAHLQSGGPALLASPEHAALYGSLAESAGALAQTLYLAGEATAHNAPVNVQSAFEEFASIATNPELYQIMAKSAEIIAENLNVFSQVPVSSVPHAKSAIASTIASVINPGNYEIIAESAGAVAEKLRAVRQAQHTKSSVLSPVNSLLSSEATAELYGALSKSTASMAGALAAALSSFEESSPSVVPSVQLAVTQGAGLGSLEFVAKSAGVIAEELFVQAPKSLAISKSAVPFAILGEEIAEQYAAMSEAASTAASILNAIPKSVQSQNSVPSVAGVVLTNEAAPKLLNAIAQATGAVATASQLSTEANAPNAGAFAKSANAATYIAGNQVPYQVISKSAAVIASALKEAEQSSRSFAPQTSTAFKTSANNFINLSEYAAAVAKALNLHPAPNAVSVAQVLSSPASAKLFAAIEKTIVPVVGQINAQTASAANEVFAELVEQV